MNILHSILLILLVELALGAEIPERRIAGGSPTTIGYFKYVGQLIVNFQLMCGATLISSYHFLTAAFCVVYYVTTKDPSIDIHIMVGSSELYSGTRYDIARVSHHKNYLKKITEYFNDNIAVVHTVKPVRESESIVAIGLPTAGSNVLRKRLIVIAGYGYYSEDNLFSPTIKTLSLKVSSVSSCEAYFEKILTDTQFCAGTPVNDGCCYGDDGSAAVDVKGETILGIVSVNPESCMPGVPVVFTKVAPYRSYIDSELNYKKYDPFTWTDHPGFDFPLLQNETLGFK